MSDSKQPGRMEHIRMRFGVIGEMLYLFSSGKRWWMAPLVLILGIAGLALVVLHSFEYVAPFIYVAF